MGFVRNKSIVDNAKLHVGSRYVYNIDLKDFFPSIDQARVWKCLQLKPFNLSRIEKNISDKANDTNDDFILPMLIFNSKNNNLIKFHFYQKNYEPGIHKIKMKNDGVLTYKIIPTCKNQKSLDYRVFKRVLHKKYNISDPIGIGEIIVFKRDSDFNHVNTIAQNLKEKNNLDVDIQIIINGLLKIVISKNTPVATSNRSIIANIIASLCCTEMEVERKNESGEWEKVKRNVLPQGAPTSPVISNIVCQKLDYLLTGVAKRFGLKYSRYADDITFSSIHNVYKPDSEFLKELHRIIAEQHFNIKDRKTRLQKDGYRKEVTGLLVNEKANVQQRYIKQLRMWLYYWERYGYEKASGFFLKQYITDKGNVKKGKPEMGKVIAGKLEYLKMVKGSDNELYQNLKVRFEKNKGKIIPETKNLVETKSLKIRNPSLIKLLSERKKEPIIILEEKNIELLTNFKTQDKLIPIIHKPKNLVSLLKRFSSNDSALKYTTHSWDAGRDASLFKDLSEFLSRAKSEYSEFSYALKNLSVNLNGKIYNFLFNKEIAETGWGDIDPKKRIYFGWSSPELLEACKNDISLNPEDFILPEKFQIQRAGKTLQKFKHIIDVFKNEIEVRDENSALLNLILQKHDSYLISFSPPKKSNLENKTFYTDIQWLSKALDLIFEGIQKYPQHPVVEYAVTENNNDRLVLTILHRNSFKNGLSIYDDKLNLKRGDFSTIKDKLQNLCDWCIESEFAEGAYRINYLVSNKGNPAYEKIMSAEGFKHILTFYK
jgi:hypothetical protein